MLTRQFLSASTYEGRFTFPARQGGVVLMIALIILVALTIGGIALVRSVDTTNIISGNLAFQQSATFSGENGTEQAINNFLELNTPVALQTDNFASAYVASTPSGVWFNAGDSSGNPADWDKYWTTVIDPSPKAMPVTAKSCGSADARGGRACTLPTDAAGNTASYVIQRLCATSGDPLSAGCAYGSKRYSVCHKPGCIPLPLATQYYYRVTTRIVGPRNTKSYIQTIVAK